MTKHGFQEIILKSLIICIFLLITVLSAYSDNLPSDPEPVTILYHDGTGTLKLDDVSTQAAGNRIVFYILNVILPEQYGINIQLKPIMWTRGLELIKSGLADGIMNASYNEERASYAVYPLKDGIPDPGKMLRLMEYNLYMNKDSSITWDGKNIEHIDGEIVSVRSFAIIKDLEEMGIDVIEEENIPGIMRNLSIGRFKAAALQNYTDEYLNEHRELKENIIKSEIPLKRKEYYLVFSRRFYNENRTLAEKIWEAIEDYSSTEEFKMKRNELEN
jgi:polar amino acid transport system substrate-binding protein